MIKRLIFCSVQDRAVEWEGSGTLTIIVAYTRGLQMLPSRNMGSPCVRLEQRVRAVPQRLQLLGINGVLMNIVEVRVQRALLAPPRHPQYDQSCRDRLQFRECGFQVNLRYVLGTVPPERYVEASPGVIAVHIPDIAQDQAVRRMPENMAQIVKIGLVNFQENNIGTTCLVKVFQKMGLGGAPDTDVQHTGGGPCSRSGTLENRLFLR